MIYTENSFVYTGGNIRGQDLSADRRKGSGSVVGDEDFLDSMKKAAGRAQEKPRSADEVIEEDSKDDKLTSHEALMRVISEQREEILRKLKNGDTQTKIPIGSMSLTEEEWEKLLDSFDKAQEKIQESIRAENGEDLPEKRPDTTVNGDKVFETVDTGHEAKSLEELISEVGLDGKVEGHDEGFEKYMSGVQVTTKTGDCNVSSGVWGRTDFPFWEYFKEGTSADALNDWRPSGPEPSMLDAGVQRNLQGIGYGKVCILIPEKLQAKMNADPAYAEEIYRKVAKWKADYDARDNATAASLGMNVAAHQFSKSYCIQLDEEGNVGNFTVTGGGLDITENKADVEDNWLKRRNAAILFHKQHLAREGYTGLTGTAGIVADEGEGSSLAVLRAALAAEVLLSDNKEKRAEPMSFS